MPQHAVAGARPPLNRVLLLAVVAGLLAGMAAALFNAVLSEPIIDRAIAFEEQAAPADAHTSIMASDGTEHTHSDDAPVSRDGQRLGLWLGWGGLGIAWGTLAGAAYYLGWRQLAGAGAAWWRVAVAAGGWFALGALPFLKYPANPPAVGDPDTINERMRNFIGIEVLAVGAVIAGIAVGVTLWRRTRDHRTATVVGLAVTLGLGAVLFFAFPSVTQETAAPASLIEEFRRHAFVGQMVFWGVFAAGFGWLPVWRRLRIEQTSAQATKSAARGDAWAADPR